LKCETEDAEPLPFPLMDVFFVLLPHGERPSVTK
jgi:hypothetical protein